MAMNNFLEVKEFDYITCNKIYADVIKFIYLDKKIFDELKEFIYKNNNVDSNISNFMIISFKKYIGEVISIRNYVGVIKLKSGFQIQILPKIWNVNSKEDTYISKKVFTNMVTYLDDFPANSFNSANLNISNMNIYEIFIAMYIKDVEKLTKVGLSSNYINKEDNLNFFKRKLLVNENIRHNLVHKERFYMTYDEYSKNIVENRLIKTTLLKLNKTSKSQINIRKIKHLLDIFSEIGLSYNVKDDLEKINLNRNMNHYKNIMLWTEIFLLNKTFSPFNGDINTKSILFKMDSLFEAYVGKKIKNILMKKSRKVKLQDNKFYLFNNPSPKFKIRPDIVLRKDGKVIIMDTKWKTLIDNYNKNYGISQADMYQMYAYSKKYNTPNIYLLYPLANHFKNHTDIYFSSNDETNINIEFIDLTKIDDSLNKLLNSNVFL